jgi:phage N-6-adenine-methyltransferase
MNSIASTNDEGRRAVLRPSTRTLGLDDWTTPPEVFDPIHGVFEFDLDACASDASVSRCSSFISPEMNALSVEWAAYGRRIWCNPPYGRSLPLWFVAARRAMEGGADLCVMLVMANTDTSYWHKHVRSCASEVVFLTPRIRFRRPNGDVMAGAPKGSALVIYDATAGRQTVHSYWNYRTEPWASRGP